MKRISIAFFAVTTISNAFASDTALVFRDVSYTQIFELAKKEKKAVILYFHADGCGACLKMQKTIFADKKVADYYNSNFVCLSVNARKGEGIEINKIYKVQLFPELFFLDENKNILHEVGPIFNPDEFILQGQNALNPLNNLTYYKQQNKEGKRDVDFLFEYSKKLHSAFEIDSLVLNEYLNTQSLIDLGKEKNIRFIYEYSVLHAKIYTPFPFNSIAFNFMLNNREKFYQYFDKDQVDFRIILITKWKAREAIENQEEIIFNECMEVLKKFDNGKEYYLIELNGDSTGWSAEKNIVLSNKMKYYDKAGNMDMYNDALKQYMEKIWGDSKELNNLAWSFYKKSDDKAKLEKAIECIKRSIELNSKYDNNDTYACLLFRQGHYDEALTQAEKAIVLAKQNNKDYKATTALIEKIKEKSPR